ncbi:hypothetical protein XENORESO_021883 [Xenotaenia resolanae]|uniref:Uncharacterized protein n=1 Tax=Xenotaenia resolanae TaxID=208358 RepID=A0ABV0VPB8_9TELE
MLVVLPLPCVETFSLEKCHRGKRSTKEKCGVAIVQLHPMPTVVIDSDLDDFVLLDRDLGTIIRKNRIRRKE